MRDIIFRGKRIDNGEWAEGYYVHAPAKNFINSSPLDDSIIKHWIVTSKGRMYEVIPETIGQFTGLTDKNGTKIFEGDVISIPFEEDRSLWEENCVYYENGKVYFDNERYGWYVEFSDGGELSIWEYDEVEIVVIGNIHDNSELLKEGVDSV